jgi:hypothetical protein
MALAAFAITLLEAGVASAQPSPPAPIYPQEDTDRPLVLFPGMTVIDVSNDFVTFFHTNSGTTALTRFIQFEPDATLEHAFGPVELSAELIVNPTGPFGSVVATTMLGPGAVSVQLSGSRG